MYNYIAPCIQNLAISCIVYYTYRQYKIRIIRITYCCDTLQNEPGRRKHPHLNRRGTILITIVNITHLPTGRDGMRRRGNEIIKERFP